MAEEQKDKKPSGIDAIFAGAESWLKSAAKGESKLLKYASLGQIGGDSAIADKVEKLGIDKVVAFPGTFLERAVVTPIKMAYGLDAGVQFVGTRIGASLSTRRRLAAEEYAKGTGPWSKKGIIYGNADRIAESSPSYETAYLGEREAQSKRDQLFATTKDNLQLEIRVQQAAGNRAAALAKKAELRDLKRRKKNIALSAAKPPAMQDDFDKANIQLGTNRATLSAEKATFLPRVPVFRQLKQRQMERAVRHKDKKSKLAKNIMANAYGETKMSDFRAKVSDLKTQIRMEYKKGAMRDEARIADMRLKLRNLESSISGSERVVAGIFGDLAA